LVHRPIEDLLRAARLGDGESIAELCEAHYPAVLKYMRYRVDASSAEDLTNEVFLRVLGHVEEQKGSFIAWLYRIAANVVIDHARTKGARKETAVEEKKMDAIGSVGVPSERSDRRMDIETAMTELTDDQRELVTLKFIQGLSNAEIGEVTGRSPEAIRGLQFRALRAMQETLSKGT
jgi:RNA polymerase sigma-70 factor, ECF subfamily